MARQHNATRQAEVEIPAMPDEVAARAEELWRAAVMAARGEHDAERLGFEAQVLEARAEAERDVAREQLAQLRQELEHARVQTQEQRSRADRAEALLGQLQAEREGDHAE